MEGWREEKRGGEERGKGRDGEKRGEGREEGGRKGWREEEGRREEGEGERRGEMARREEGRDGEKRPEWIVDRGMERRDRKCKKREGWWEEIRIKREQDSQTKSHAQPCEIRYHRRERGGRENASVCSHLVEVVVCLCSLQVYLLFVPVIHAGKQLIEDMKVPLLPRLHRAKESAKPGDEHLFRF